MLGLGWFTGLAIARKLVLGFSLVLLCMVGVGIVTLSTAHSIDATSTLMVSDAIPTNNAIRAILPDVVDEETGVRAFMITGQEKALSAYQLGRQGLAADLAVLAAHYAQQPALRRLIEGQIKPELRPITAFYARLIAQVRAGHIMAARAQIYTAKALVHALRVSQASVVAEAAATISRAHQAIMAALARMVAMVIACTLGAAVLAMLVALVLTRTIARPLQRLTGAARRLAGGDMAVQSLLPADTANGDEVGALGSAFRAMVTYQHEMAQVAALMAAGDLTRTVKAKGTRDTLGHAFITMSANLRTLLGQVARSSERVDAGATQLAHAGEQVGAASTQIARAIEEVARGAGAQSQSAAEAMTQMTALSAAAVQVSAGADEQSTAVARAGLAIEDLSAALAQTTEGVAAVAVAANRAAATARDGGAAVAQTIASIGAIRATVQQSAVQVQALGQRSAEVGAIVQAIDDIAGQTNLLALNAAIEAARAGEHGKGFAVVAAEVRKLAERATDETKEITQRITVIQRQIAEAVAAMELGSAEVEKSAALGRQADGALRDILGVVEETNTQATAIGSATRGMSTSVEAVRAATEHVASVATQTVEAARRMSDGAARVGVAMESIAAVSEQSAAGAQEVSASTQEQSAGVQELAAGAQELLALAHDLQGAVGRFVLNTEESGIATPPTEDSSGAEPPTEDSSGAEPPTEDGSGAEPPTEDGSDAVPGHNGGARQAA